MWAPLPQSNVVQRVSRLRMSPPLKAKLASDNHGNRLLYMSGKVPKRGILKLRVEALVERREWSGAASGPEELELYLKPTRLVPVSGEVEKLLEGEVLPEDRYGSARKLYDVVLAHMSYDKSREGYGRGDTLWACSSGTGNCTDFHSLFLSLARFSGIPARFEIGYPLPAGEESGKIPGYHCWASFWNGEGWVPVDISEADKHPEKVEYFFGNLDPDRVTLSAGRDLVFEPEQASGPLNFFVKPLLEVEGRKVESAEMKVFFGPPKPVRRRR